MCHASLVQIFHGATELDHEPPYFRQGEAPPLFNHIHNRPIGTYLEYDVGAFVEGKGAVESNYMRMSHFGVDLKLGAELYHASVRI